jgi:hypothetical protein
MHTSEVCNIIPFVQWYLAIKDNHDSWRMCTTSVECKIGMTVMLKFMSGMDSHMISWNLGSDLIK